MTTEVVPIQKAPLRAGGPIAAIIPTNIEETYRLANAIHAAGMAPKSLNTAEKCMVAIMHGLEVGLTPMAALQSIAVVNGMPTIWGDGALGLVRGSGLLAGFQEWTEGEGDAETAHCEVIRAGEAPLERKFSIADAKRAGLLSKDGPWRTYPQRMLQMRARAWALRDGFADVLKGLRIHEEVQDYTPIREEPAPTGIAARLAAAKAEATTPNEGFVVTHSEVRHVDRTVTLERVESEPVEADPAPEASEAPATQEAVPGATSGEAEAIPEAMPDRISDKVFLAYSGALARFETAEDLKKANKQFWTDQGGYPSLVTDVALVTKIGDAHKNRVAGKISAADCAAYVVDLLDEEFGA